MSNVTINHDWSHPSECYAYTALCSMPDTPRGMYDEEIDLVAARRPSLAEVRRVAQVELDENYHPGMKVRRLVKTWGR